ncbi:MAG TPA: type II toxin-antitoxin system prevent-host-death family antitoxin [Tepidisphaeraceae bacterium]|nr:type II toxin-antitoxin system prevent-host-death family antitoxin [Tepidisphaeraceae bacterium]
MRIPISEAESRLSELVQRAEAGEEIVLTRDGHPTVQLVLVVPPPKPLDRETRRRILQEVRASARGKAKPGPSAARSQDFLYGDHGLPK